MQIAVKVVISFPVNPDKNVMYGVRSQQWIFKKENLANKWFFKNIFVFLVKDNNSDLASRRCSHDPYVF